MAFLLRVVLSDRPGMLGALATALGGVEGDIVSVDVVERAPGVAVDDLVIELPAGRLPDTLITAAHSVDGVHVESIRSYAGALDTMRELELVDWMTSSPSKAAGILIGGLPRIFRAGWSLLLRQHADGTVRVDAASDAAPELVGATVPDIAVPPLRTARVLDVEADRVPGTLSALDADLVATPYGRPDRALVLGRPGGPAFRASEVARLAHLAGIAITIRSGAGTTRG